MFSFKSPDDRDTDNSKVVCTVRQRLGFRDIPALGCWSLGEGFRGDSGPECSGSAGNRRWEEDHRLERMQRERGGGTRITLNSMVVGLPVVVLLSQLTAARRTRAESDFKYILDVRKQGSTEVI